MSRFLDVRDTVCKEGKGNYGDATVSDYSISSSGDGGGGDIIQSRGGNDFTACQENYFHEHCF